MHKVADSGSDLRRIGQDTQRTLQFVPHESRDRDANTRSKHGSASGSPKSRHGHHMREEREENKTLEIGHVHDDEDGAHDDALHPSAQDWVRNDGQRLVNNHVRE